MATYSQLLYHIVFSTKDRVQALNVTHRDKLLGYIFGILKNKGSYVYRLNMMPEHVHILCSIKQSETVSDTVKIIKNATNLMIRKEKLFPMFYGWQIGYGVFTITWNDRDRLISYIKNQQEHHKKYDFVAEMKKMYDEFGLSYQNDLE